MNILCIGKLTYDIFCPMDTFPEANKKYMNNERSECGGGEVANAAYLLGKWGLKPTIAGVVGSDDFGTKIKKEFDGVQVDTSLVETSYETPTIISMVMVNKTDGSNIIIRNYKRTFASLRKQDLGMTPDVIISDGHEYGATHLMLERNPKAKTIIIAEENKPEILELCKFSKYILCSQEFAESTTNVKCDFNNPQTLVSVYQTLKNRFPNNEIIVSTKNKGALYSLDGEIKVMPGINAKVIDKSGAGDAFRAAFIYGLVNNFSMDKIITYANIAAGLTIEKVGTRMAFPSLNEVINYYNQKFPPQVSTNTTVTQSAPQQPPVVPNMDSQSNNANANNINTQPEIAVSQQAAAADQNNTEML